MVEVLSGVHTLKLQSSDLRRIARTLLEDDTSHTRNSDQAVLALIGRQNPETDERQLTLSRLVNDAALARGIHSDLERDIEIGEDGRERVSEHFWRKIVSNISGRPWAFICNYAENSASAVHGDIHGISYGFHDNVTTWRGIVASAENSYVLFYNTVNAPENRRHYTAVARVESIEEITVDSETSRRSWRASLRDFHSFKPVPFDAIKIDGRNHQHGIQAVTWETVLRILELGGRPEQDLPVIDLDLRPEPRVKIEHNFEEVLKHGPRTLELSDPTTPTIESSLQDYDPIERMNSKSVKNRSSSSNRRLDKLTEESAVLLATTYLTALGWVLKDDCQLDGVGYDFEFEKNGKRVLVEVKGIRGDQLAFNMTAKEWHVCRTNDDFVLLAVTNVLDLDKYQIHVLRKAQIFLMNRRATQFRLT
jgi:hypothetical protein